MPTLLLLLTLWPFAPAARPGRTHIRAWHASHLRHIQAARAHALAHRHGAPHPSLINR